MLPIFLCNDKPHLDVPSISICPRDQRWNDFSRNYHVDIFVCLERADKIFSYRALIMPLNWDDLESDQRFDDWANAKIPIGKNYVELTESRTSDGRPSFVTLLDGESTYRSLALDIEQEIRVNILDRINDLAYISRNNILAERDRTAILETENFQLGFMRRGSAYQALHRGHRHIWGVGKELLKDARVPFSFDCKLHGFAPSSHTLSVGYVNNALLEDRVHCLIGKNGCGKTRLLKELILNFSNLSEENESCFLDNFESTADKPPLYRGPQFRRVLCFAFDSQAEFPTATRNDSRFEYIFTNLASGAELTAAESSTSVHNLTRLLVDILRNEDALGDGVTAHSRYSILKKSLRPYVDFSNVLIPLLDEASAFAYQVRNGKKWIPLENLRRMNEKAALIAFSYIDVNGKIAFCDGLGRFYKLSSGHRVFFEFAISFLSYIDIGTLVILDEPETHLHPNLVCDFMNLIYEVLSSTKSISLIATHSAYVVREVPTHCAHLYLLDDAGLASENQVYLRTLGANVENISQAVFGDSNANKFHQKIIEAMDVKGKSFENIIEDFSALMSPDLLSKVAELINSEKIDS